LTAVKKISDVVLLLILNRIPWQWFSGPATDTDLASSESLLTEPPRYGFDRKVLGGMCVLVGEVVKCTNASRSPAYYQVISGGSTLRL